MAAASLDRLKAPSGFQSASDDYGVEVTFRPLTRKQRQELLQYDAVSRRPVLGRR
jgi:hypothetical protein